MYKNSIKIQLVKLRAFNRIHFSFFYKYFKEPDTTILGGDNLYIDTGSTINLTCVVKDLPEPPPAIYWTHNGNVSCFCCCCCIKYIIHFMYTKFMTRCKITSFINSTHNFHCIFILQPLPPPPPMSFS